MTTSSGSIPAPIPSPNRYQRLALESLLNYRLSKIGTALTVLSSGAGKTLLAVFDSIASKSESVLYIAHRIEILQQARRAFLSVGVSGSDTGLISGEWKNYDYVWTCNYDLL